MLTLSTEPVQVRARDSAAPANSFQAISARLPGSHPARRNAEAALLEQAIGRGDLASYLVQPGDTLSGVASRRGTSADYLAARNGLADPDYIYGGQALYY